jgi:hypothetical protein
VFSRFFFKDSRSQKNTLNTEVFGALEAEKHSIYGFATGNKSHAFCSGFWTAPSKNTLVFTQLSACCIFLMQK